MSDSNEFYAQIINRGISRKNRFRVTIPLPAGIFDSNATAKSDTNNWNSGGLNNIFQGIKIVSAFYGGMPASARNLQAMCYMAGIPSVGIDTSVLNQNGNHIKIPTNKTQNDIDFSFFLPKDYFERKIMDAWKNLIIDPYTSKMGYYDDFKCDILIEQLDERGNSVHQSYLYEAVPTTFSQIDLDKSSADTFQQFNVSFTYNKLLSATEYEQRSTRDDFLPLGIIDAIAAGEWETAAQKSGQMWRKLQDGNLTGESLFIRQQIDDIIKNSTGVSLHDFEIISNGMKRDINNNNRISVSDKIQLTNMLNDLVKK